MSEREKFTEIEANIKEIAELIEDFHTILRTSSKSSGLDDQELLNTFCQDFDLTTEKMVSSIIAILPDFELAGQQGKAQGSVRSDVNYIIDDIDELSVNTIELLNEHLEFIPEDVQLKADGNFKEILELIRDLTFIIQSSLGVSISMPTVNAHHLKEEAKVNGALLHIGGGPNETGGLTPREDSEMGEKSALNSPLLQSPVAGVVEHVITEKPEDYFANLLEKMDADLEQMSTQAQESQVDKKLEKQIRLALKSVRAILKPNIEAVADPEERGDYQGLLQDYVGTVKSYLKSVKKLSSEQDDELQDEIQDKTEEIKDLVRALRTIPIKVLPVGPSRSDAFSSENTDTSNTGDVMEISLSSSGEDEALDLEAVMRAQREAMGSIMEMMDQRDDLEYFTLLEKLEDLCEKQKQAVMHHSHAIIFLNHSIQQSTAKLVHKIRKVADVENLSTLSSMNLFLFDLLDALEEETAEFINYAKNINRFHKRLVTPKNDEYPATLQMFEFTLAKLKQIYDELSTLKEREIEERDAKRKGLSDSNSAKFEPMKPFVEPVKPALALYLAKPLPPAPIITAALSHIRLVATPKPDEQPLARSDAVTNSNSANTQPAAIVSTPEDVKNKATLHVGADITVENGAAVKINAVANVIVGEKQSPNASVEPIKPPTTHVPIESAVKSPRELPALVEEVVEEVITSPLKPPVEKQPVKTEPKEPKKPVVEPVKVVSNPEAVRQQAQVTPSPVKQPSNDQSPSAELRAQQENEKNRATPVKPAPQEITLTLQPSPVTLLEMQVQDLELRPEALVLMEEEVVVRRKRDRNAPTIVPTDYRKVEVVEQHVPKHLEAIHNRSKQRDILERIQQEEANRSGKTEFQRLAQKLARKSLLTSSTSSDPDSVNAGKNVNSPSKPHHAHVPHLAVNSLSSSAQDESVALTPMQRLIKLDEVQKEVYRKEQEERQKQKANTPTTSTTNTPSKGNLPTTPKSTGPPSSRYGSPSTNSVNVLGPTPRITKKNWFAAFEDTDDKEPKSQPAKTDSASETVAGSSSNSQSSSHSASTSSSYFNVMAPKRREELIRAGLDPVQYNTPPITPQTQPAMISSTAQNTPSTSTSTVTTLTESVSLVMDEETITTTNKRPIESTAAGKHAVPDIQTPQLKQQPTTSASHDNLVNPLVARGSEKSRTLAQATQQATNVSGSSSALVPKSSKLGAEDYSSSSQRIRFSHDRPVPRPDSWSSGAGDRPLSARNSNSSLSFTSATAKGALNASQGALNVSASSQSSHSGEEYLSVVRPPSIHQKKRPTGSDSGEGNISVSLSSTGRTLQRASSKRNELRQAWIASASKFQFVERKILRLQKAEEAVTSKQKRKYFRPRRTCSTPIGGERTRLQQKFAALQSGPKSPQHLTPSKLPLTRPTSQRLIPPPQHFLIRRYAKDDITIRRTKTLHQFLELNQHGSNNKNSLIRRLGYDSSASHSGAHVDMSASSGAIMASPAISISATSNSSSPIAINNTVSHLISSGGLHSHSSSPTSSSALDGTGSNEHELGTRMANKRMQLRRTLTVKALEIIESSPRPASPHLLSPHNTNNTHFTSPRVFSLHNAVSPQLSHREQHSALQSHSPTNSNNVHVQATPSASSLAMSEGSTTTNSATVIPALTIPTESDAFDDLLSSPGATAEDAAKIKRREMMKRPSIRATLLSPRSSQMHLDIRQAAANSASSSQLMGQSPQQSPTSPRAVSFFGSASSSKDGSKDSSKSESPRILANFTSSASSPRGHVTGERPRSHEVTEMSDQMGEMPLSLVRQKEKEAHHQSHHHKTGSSHVHGNLSSPSLKHFASAKETTKTNKDAIASLTSSKSSRDMTSSDKRKSDARAKKGHEQVPSLGSKISGLNDAKEDKDKLKKDRSSTARDGKHDRRRDKLGSKTGRSLSDKERDKSTGSISSTPSNDSLVHKESKKSSRTHRGEGSQSTASGGGPDMQALFGKTGRERGESDVALKLPSVFTIHLSDTDKKTVTKSNLLLRDVLDKMLSARGIDEALKKSYVCCNANNQPLDTSLPLSSFEETEVYYCPAAQVPALIQHWLNKKQDTTDSPAISARSAESELSLKTSRSKNSLVSASGTESSLGAPTPRSKDKGGMKTNRDSLRGSAKDLAKTKDEKDEKEEIDRSLMGSISRAFSSNKKDRFSSSRMDKKNNVFDSPSHDGTDDTHDGHGHANSARDTSGMTSNNIHVTSSNNLRSARSGKTNNNPPKIFIPVDVLGEHTPEKQEKEPARLSQDSARLSMDQAPERPQQETPRTMLSKKELTGGGKAVTGKAPERPHQETPRAMTSASIQSHTSSANTNASSSTSTSISSTAQPHPHSEFIGSAGMKKALANSLSLLLIHCEDFNTETKTGGVYSVKLDIPTKNGLKVRRTKGVQRRMNFVMFNELLTVDFPQLPIKLQYIYKTMEGSKQTSVVVLGEHSIGMEIFAENQLNTKQKKIIKVPMTNPNSEAVEFFFEICFSTTR